MKATLRNRLVCLSLATTIRRRCDKMSADAPGFPIASLRDVEHRSRFATAAARGTRFARAGAMARVAGRDGFTRAHAIGLIWIGWTLVGATVLGAIVFSLASGVRSIGQTFVVVGIPDGISGLLAAALILTAGSVLGLGLGTPFIVAGQLILIALDQRRLLAEQARTLRRIRRGLAPLPQPRPAAAHEPARLLNRLSPR
jgi:hypothetical protein